MGPISYKVHIINSKYTKDLNKTGKCRTSGKPQGGKLLDIGPGRNFLFL